MTPFGNDLIQSLDEALAHAKGEGPAIVHTAVSPREVREALDPTQAENGTARGHKSFRLADGGAGHAPRQRPRCGTGPGHPQLGNEPAAIQPALLD